MRDGDLTIVVGFHPGAEPADGPVDEATFVAIATAVLDSGSDDLATLCDAALAAAPGSWGDFNTPVLGSGAGSVNGVEHSYESCSTSLPDGDSLQIQVGDGRLFEAEAATDRVGRQEPADRVPGLGDLAVRHSGRIYVRVGDRAAAVDATPAEGQPERPGEVEDLAAATARALR